MMQLNRSESPKRVAIYIRSYQLKHIDDITSIQVQLDHCKAYCAEHGYTLSEDQIYNELREETVETDRPDWHASEEWPDNAS